MSLSSGTRLGPCQVLSRVGDGAMGEIYKARNTRLGRTVAIKGSATQFTEREARAVAALNHSQTWTLHDVGPDYLEYIEGEPLSGPLAPEKALGIAEIADALDTAARSPPRPAQAVLRAALPAAPQSLHR